MQGEEKLSPRLLLAATIFLLLCHAQNLLHVVFGGEQFYHFFSRLLVLWIPLFVLRLQHGILLFQRLYGRQFLQTEGIKVPLRRLTGRYFIAMLFIKFLPFPAAPKEGLKNRRMVKENTGMKYGIAELKSDVWFFIFQKIFAVEKSSVRAESGE